MEANDVRLKNLEKRKGFDVHPENISGGRPKGSKNRATIARAILSMEIFQPDTIILELRKMYPNMTNSICTEEVMTMIQAKKAIEDKDTAAYKALMDSAYGAPSQLIDIEGDSTNRIVFENASKRFDVQSNGEAVLKESE